MQFNVAFDRPDDNGDDAGPARVGWLLDDPKAGIVFSPPERVRSVDTNMRHAKSAARCPAVINLESRYFVIKCPFTLQIRFERDSNGRPKLRNVLGDNSPVRGKTLSKILHVTAESEWRYKNRPTVQIALPYVFIADETVYISQVAPFMHYSREPLPGTIFGGRFPINIWPRPLMWAFEWHEPDKDIKLTRGDPLFYVLFETDPQDRPVQLVEAAKTPELLDYLNLISGTVNYVNQTFSLFKSAEERRPARLVVPKET
ncbi:MAG: hypothetical protein ACR2PA_00875 [Hyphomicrobiaceae bacterium]